MLGVEVEERFSRLAKSIVGDAGITFRFEGNAYYCEKKGSSFIINFASPPAQVTEPYIKSLEGFLDHEVAHALFTDYRVLESIPSRVKSVFGSSKPLEVVKALQNLVEDYRIEEAMKDRYRGSKDHLDYMNQRLHEDLHSKDNPPESRWVGLQLALHFAIYQSEPPAYLDPFTNEVVDKASDLVLDARRCRDTAGALAVAIELYKRLNKDEESDPEEKESPEESKKDKNSDGKSGSGGESKIDVSGNSLKEDWKYGLVKSEVNSDLAGNQRIGSPPQNYGPEFPRPFTRSKDRLVREDSVSLKTYPKNPGLNFMAMKLGSLFKAEKLTSFDRGVSRGKVCSSSLYRINTDSQIFKRKVNPEQTTDVCFCFGIDNSDSMNLEEAAEIIHAIFDLLGKVGVPFMVFTYTTERSNDNLSEPYVHDLSFTRTIPLVINLIKDFSESTTSRRSKLNLKRGGFTPTPEAYEYSLSQLKNRPEKHRVFINLTDGYPQENVLARTGIYYERMLKNLMSEFTRRGIEYLNVGYELREGFYSIDPHALLVDADNCVAKLVQALTKKIRRGRVPF